MAMPKESAPADSADSAEWGKREWHRCEAEKRCAARLPTLAPSHMPKCHCAVVRAGLKTHILGGWVSYQYNRRRGALAGKQRKKKWSKKKLVCSASILGKHVGTLGQWKRGSRRALRAAEPA